MKNGITIRAAIGLALLIAIFPVAGWGGTIEDRGGLVCATADVLTGLALILRMGTAVAAANLFSMTTRLADLMALVERFSAPLSRLGLPPSRLALAIGLALRFVPVFLTRLGQIGDALRARSPRRPGWRVLAPATLAALDDADRVAEALRARGGVD